ncbi:2-hydroxycarboxylate transporter family protein [Psychrilyobacter atlanticus]|uniref:2-hydroxycarboxylate transporter family protein n=1 Tax=Psychrilyobacter atlanticus TaxID=271091 RepID=UPI0004203F1D|nr:2-hydroxycarboxylate transporter family protein [Psychrilyobacter atlanticus]
MKTAVLSKDKVQKKFKLLGLEMKYFIPITAVVLGAAFTGALPKGMEGVIPFLLIMGVLLNEIGNRTPIIKDYFGGGPIVAIFAAAALVTYNVLPETVVSSSATFMKSGGFLNFYIAALITGSILGMDTKLLIKAGLKYLPVIIGGVFVSILMTGTVGALMGYGFTNAVFYIAIPIMGGGMGAGAVPLAQIFGKAMEQDPTKLLSIMVPAVALGNAVAIVCAGILNKLGKKYKKISGDGKLLKGQDDVGIEEEKELKIDYASLGKGLLIATSFYVLGRLLGKYIPLHPYALMILSVAFAKLTGILKREHEEAATTWFQFVMKNFTLALLVGIGIAYTDLGAVISAFSLTYLLLVVTTIVGAMIGTAIVGRMLGFYMIEGTITAGLCMANMGGTGDIAVLSAANRMELLPFSQISSRIGGAFMLILTSLLINLFV